MPAEFVPVRTGITIPGSARGLAMWRRSTGPTAPWCCIRCSIPRAARSGARRSAAPCGWATRPAAVVLLVNITVAIVTTKVPILLGQGFLGFTLTRLKQYGLLSMMHEARTDFAMWFGLLFLIIAGPGRWALDFRNGSPTRKP